MSLQGLQFIIGKAATDAAFREQLKAAPKKMAREVTAGTEHQLTDDELRAVARMDWDGLEGVAHDLDARISRMSFGRGAGALLMGDGDPTCDCDPDTGSNPDA